MRPSHRLDSARDLPCANQTVTTSGRTTARQKACAQRDRSCHGRAAEGRRRAHLVEVALGEDQAHVADQRLGNAGPLLVASALAVQADGALHHRVLAHQHHALAMVPQALFRQCTSSAVRTQSGATQAVLSVLREARQTAARARPRAPGGCPGTAWSPRCPRAR